MCPKSHCFAARIWLPRHVNGQIVALKMSLCQEICNGLQREIEILNERLAEKDGLIEDLKKERDDWKQQAEDWKRQANAFLPKPRPFWPWSKSA